MNAVKKYFSSIKERFKIKNYLTYFIFLIIIAILLPLGLTGSLKSSNEFLLEQIGYNIIAAISLSLVVGFLGELSLGHAGFMCIGAMFGTLFQSVVYPNLTQSAPLLALIIAMLIGGLIAGIFGILIGLPALRLKGDYLAIVTLAFCQIVKTVFNQIKLFCGETGTGIANQRYDRHTLFIVMFVVALLSLIVINNFIKSKHGRAVMAIRDNEIAARAMGVNVSFNKIFVFAFSSFIAGIAGVLVAATQSTVSANQFDYNYSINILVMVVLGGMGNINGSIVAATLITFLNVTLNKYLPSEIAPVKDVIYALILILLVIYNNAPKMKNMREKYNLRNLYEWLKGKVVKLFTKKQAQPDPANEKEFGADWSKVPTKIEMDAILSTDVTPSKTYEPDKPDKNADKGEGDE